MAKGKNAKKGANKNSNPSNMAMVPLGPQSVANVLPRQTRYRTLAHEAFQSKAFATELREGVTSTSTYGPVGTKYLDITLLYKLTEFFVSDQIKRWDAYRIDEIQVYAYLIDADCTVRIMTSIDQDDTSVISWGDLRKRTNVSTTVLRLQNPMQLIAKWKPYPLYTPTTQGDSVANRIGVPGTWFDTAASSQPFGALKIHMEGSSPLAAQVDPKIGFLARAKVTWRAPL